MLRPSHHFGGWKDNSLHGRFLVWLHNLRHAFVHNTERYKNTVKIQIFNDFSFILSSHSAITGSTYFFLKVGVLG